MYKDEYSKYFENESFCMQLLRIDGKLFVLQNSHQKTRKKQVTNILSTRFIHTNIFRWFPRFPLANKNRIQIHVSCYILLTTVEYIVVLHRYVDNVIRI